MRKGILHVRWRELPEQNDMIDIEAKWEEENEPFLYYVFPDDTEYRVETGMTKREPV